MATRHKRSHRNPATLALQPNVTENVVQLFHGDRSYHLSHPINLQVRHEHGHYLISYEPLNLEVWETDEHEALWAFTELFDDTWKCIAEAPDQKLTGDARDLKRKLRDLVAKVESVKVPVAI